MHVCQTCMCACVCAGMLSHVPIWRPELNIKCHFLLLSTLFLETGSLTGTWNQFSKAGRAVVAWGSAWLHTQAHETLPGFCTWILEVPPQILMRPCQALSPLSHLPSQLVAFTVLSVENKYSLCWQPAGRMCIVLEFLLLSCWEASPRFLSPVPCPLKLSWLTRPMCLCAVCVHEYVYACSSPPYSMRQGLKVNPKITNTTSLTNHLAPGILSL